MICLIVLCCLLVNVAKGNNPSVIIVGAGPSGIAAAAKLLEHNITNITILEAENRFGGRIHSIKFGDSIVDLGAEFCHGEKNNIVYELTKDLDILKPSNFNIRHFYSDGTEITGEIANDITEFYDTFDDQIQGDSAQNKGLSVGEAFLKRYNSTFIPKYINDERTRNISRDLIRNFEGALNSLEGSFSWFEPSANSQYEECDGDQALVWNGLGYKTIFEILVKERPDPSKRLPVFDKILLNKTVTEVNWSGKQVTVATADQATYSADFVIFTPSVGVLKQQHSLLFEPHLPAAKINAIESIGFDGVQKIFMHFPTRWWNGTFLNLIWTQEDVEAGVNAFPGAPQQDGRPWFADVSGLEEPPHNPNVLIGWLAAATVPEVELSSDETVERGLVFMLDKFFGKLFNVTKPDHIIFSRWCTNPNFKGTYSFETVRGYDAQPSHQVTLGAPLERDGIPMVMFAGEATNPVHFSTVHGAIESGFREAQRIIDLFKQR